MGSAAIGRYPVPKFGGRTLEFPACGVGIIPFVVPLSVNQLSHTHGQGKAKPANGYSGWCTGGAAVVHLEYIEGIS